MFHECTISAAKVAGDVVCGLGAGGLVKGLRRAYLVYCSPFSIPLNLMPAMYSTSSNEPGSCRVLIESPEQTVVSVCPTLTPFAILFSPLTHVCVL